MSNSVSSWQIISCTDTASFKRVRVRDDARIQAVVRHLQADECVALLGPPLSEKSHLLHDIADALRATERFLPLYLDLWRANSEDEAVFFTSVARLIADALAADPLRRGAVAPVEGVADPRDFQRFLTERAGRNGASPPAGGLNLALLIDHLQALPHDLVHSLLLALRSTYMEREADAPHQVVAVVAGGMNLVGLSTGPTSPFNIAKPVVAAPLTEAQSRALAEASLAAAGCHASAQGLARLLAWAGGDRYLLPRLCAWSAALVQDYRRPVVTCPVVERAAEQVWRAAEILPPVREAIRMIEEDPDSMLDILHLLDHGALPRARARQMITRTGADRLQLSGAVTLAEGCYLLINQAYRLALAEHFTTERVGHVLRIAGRWEEAIQYLAPRLAVEQGSRGEGEQGRGGTGDAARSVQSEIRNSQSAIHSARPQLLEAIVQSLYATDSVEQGCETLANGLRLGFGLAQVSIYLANPAQGRLDLAYPPARATGPIGHQSTNPQSTNPQSTASVDLNDPACVEAQTYHYGNYALRGTADDARLVAALASQNRPLGVVTVEHYIQARDPHTLPDELPDLLGFLHHAAGALENVIFRAAYRAIGQAVLDARALQPTVERVLSAVCDALGSHYAVLYLVDDTGRTLEMAAGVGRPVTPAWQAAARFSLAGRHPAAAALRDQRLQSVRGTADGPDAPLMERLGLHKHTRVFLPLAAASEALGTLELGYAAGARLRLTEAARRTYTAFANQVAIGVHNMQLLRRTDEALTRKMAEISVGREIQLSLLPRSCPAVPGWDFAALYQAARIVGGDFYDFCELPGQPQRLGIVIADVADKGVPAALFMALSRTVIRTVALSGRGPAAALMRANDVIMNDSQAELFLSAIYAVLEPETGRLTYANAGHNRPLWVHAGDGTVTELDQPGIVLGAFEHIALTEGQIDLAAGDVVVFYTDGINEAINADGEQFGDDRLRDAVAAAAAGGTAQDVLTAITAALAAFVGETEQADDVTGVVVRRG